MSKYPKRRITEKSVRQERLENNLCILCGGKKDKEPHFKLCPSCRKRQALYRRKRKQDEL